MLDLYEVRESILEQIRNKDALPLRRIRGRIGEQLDRVADKSSTKDIPGNCDLLDLSCSNRSHTSEVPRTLSRRSGPRQLSVYEHRPGVGDVSAGDMDGCDQASETTTSAFPLPSPPLPLPPPPPPPPAEFTETDLKHPLKASSAYAHLSPTAATTTTSTPASVNQARWPGLHQLADSFQNTLRIQKNTARGFKEVSFCSARQSYGSPKSQPRIEVSSRCSPPLSGNDKRYSSRAASSFTSYQRDKMEVPERRVPVRLHDDKSAKPVTIRKSLDPCSPLRIQDSAYPSSVAASSSETGHTEDLPASRTRAYSQYEVRQQPTAGVSRSLRSNALGGQGVDLQQDSAQKFNQSPLVYDFHRYGRETASELAAEREPKYPEKKRTSVDKDRFPEADYPTLKSLNSPTSKEDSGVQTGLEDDVVNTHSQQVLSGSSAWRSRSSTLPSFHASSVGTEAYLTTPESSFLESDCLKSTWSFPRHSIYEEKSIRQKEAPTERSAVMPLAAGRPICPPHHYTGLGMFQGLAPKIFRSNSQSSESLC
ncbi:unnamed protein product [Dibothriocephalus latus]|uniref:Uncharacterized protein n=1 Tax=Dibothriocephalus latus TaxID=60516 RepID=A0A3P7LGH1_DIBLA|nr:unnamed protein product [Dibothriocephalus latus]